MASSWTDELRETVIKEYTDSKPTPETSTEIVKEIAEKHELTPNGVRAVLIKANKYVSKAKDNKESTDTKVGKRASKGVALEGLMDTLRKANLDVDEDIINKLTGKAAVYFSDLFKEVLSRD